MHEFVHLRRGLTGSLPRPQWPSGFRPASFAEDLAPPLHALMKASYQPGEGHVAPLQTWWEALKADHEYDPGLVFLATSADGRLAGACHAWTSAFIKDLVVTPACRGRGLAQALLLTTFAALQERGARHVDLKVLAGNARAIRLYRRLGMSAP